MFVAYVFAARANDIISCEAGKLEEGSRGQITCNFHTNVNTTKKNFSVVQYRFIEEHGQYDTGNSAYLFL